MLVAAGQAAHCLLHRGAGHAQFVCGGLSILSFCLFVEHAKFCELGQISDCDIAGDGRVGQDSLLSALLWDQRNAGLQSLANVLKLNRLAVQSDLRMVVFVHTQRRTDRLGPPCADQAKQAQDLAPADIKADVV